MARKPYKQQQAAQLLEKLVALVVEDTGQANTRQRRRGHPRAKQVLTELLTAEFGEIAVATSVAAAVQRLSDARVSQCVDLIRETLQRTRTNLKQVSFGTPMSSIGLDIHFDHADAVPDGPDMVFPLGEIRAYARKGGYRWVIESAKVSASSSAPLGGYSSSFRPVDGDIAPWLIMQTLRLLLFIGFRRLDICDPRRCGKLFVRVGKRRFCSEKCQTRVYMRRVRAGDAGKE